MKHQLWKSHSSVAALLLLLGGCGATIQEQHYFAAFPPEGTAAREPVQFYRLTVEGESKFSNTRYLTGYFDERAVSLFFNEIKAPQGETRKLFSDASVAAESKLAPLAPTAENGAFVLIMSTNADAVANTIGSFAESQVVADALTRALNRDRFTEKNRSDAQLTVRQAQAAALVTQLRSQLAAAAGSEKGSNAAADYLVALTTLARPLGYTGPQFASRTDAAAWYALESSRLDGGAP